jgi:glycolate oxidase iron-sulfur subunit
MGDRMPDTILPACVHCGLCLPACPTYGVTLHEADSPRGRIQLMLALSVGAIEPSAAVRRHLDLCLGCRGCETICPSGVVYHHLLENHRARVPADLTRRQRWIRRLGLSVLAHRRRLALAVLPVRVLRRLGLLGIVRRLLPQSLRRMLDMLPEPATAGQFSLPQSPPPPNGPEVVLLEGCSSSLGTGLEDLCAALLAAAGAKVRRVPITCCGAMHHHNDDANAARALARRVVQAVLPPDRPPPAFLTLPVAGCTAMLREYGRLLAGDALAQAAGELAGRVRDITEILMELGPPPLPHPVELTAAYHDPCHLAHAQRVTAAPRRLLAAIPGLKLVPLADSDMCCGAAGLYCLLQTEMAEELAGRKLAHFHETGAQVLVAGNAGCALHLAAVARRRGRPVRIVHPVELVARAAFGPVPR